ncbi:MAG: hypothetical protein ACE5K1_04380 [Acidiferrobacterales bacterium]
MVERYPREKPLFVTAVVVSAVFWVGLAFLLKAAAERYLPWFSFDLVALTLVLMLLLAYLVVHLRKARRVAYLRGHAVEIGPKQHPDLHSRLKSVCKRLEITDLPKAYLFQNPAVRDCFSLRFQGTKFLALSGEVIGALTDRQGAIDFVMGHELGRIEDRQARWTPFILPALVLPLLGPAYARAKIYGYDRYGIAACKAKVDAALALAVVASGTRRWKSVSVPQFAAQSASSSGFWMSLDELNSSTPWLSKRMGHLRAIATSSDTFIPRRNPLAYLAALFVPYIGTRAWRGLLRVLVIVLWVGVIGYSGMLGYQHIVRSGVVDQMASFRQELMARLHTGKAMQIQPTTRVAPLVKDNPYARLDADLRRLGELAHAQQRKKGSIPCDIDATASLTLNFRWDRYAFSCSETMVYTLVERGEFEPGRVAYMRKYDWQKKHIVAGPSER